MSVARLLTAAVDIVWETPLSGLRCSRLVKQMLLQGWALTQTFGRLVAAMPMIVSALLAAWEVASFRCSRSAHLLRGSTIVKSRNTAGGAAYK